MKYVLTTINGTKFVITKDERDDICKIADMGKTKWIFARAGEVIQINPMPEIVLYSRAKQQDQDKLNTRGLRRCSYGTIHKSAECCRCFTNRNISNPHGIFVEKLTEAQQATVRIEGAEVNKLI